jgi:hypothetical protein
MLKRLQSLTWTPEFNVVLFALLLNYPWEFLQAPLFEGMSQSPHWAAVKTCTRAALGDAVIALCAYWSVAILVRNRAWMVRATVGSVLCFIAFGATFTVVIERLVLTGTWIVDWSYSSLMPVVPVLGVGLSPLLQWVVLPPLVVWLVARQIGSTIQQA